MSAATADAPFSSRTVLLIVGAAVVAFGAFLLLVAFAPDFRSGHDARGHALSTSGNGYAGLVALTGAMGRHSVIVRDRAQLSTSALLIVTPEADSDPKALQRILAARKGHPTLIVLPKWIARPLRRHPDWIETAGTIPAETVAPYLAKLAPKLSVEQTPLTSSAIRIAAPAPQLVRRAIGPQKEQQRLAGAGFTPLLLDRDGQTVLARLDADAFDEPVLLDGGRRWAPSHYAHQPVYVLAEPDLLNNQGLADRWTARQAWQVIDDLATDNEIAFDLTLNGFATQKSALRLVFEPPLLPVTLCLVAAALLAGVHGAIRFGAPIEPDRAIAFGKRTLVDNAAMLFRAARKEHRVGAAYAALTRDLTAEAAGAPARLTGEALDGWLDRAGAPDADPPYATLAWHAQVADDRDQLLGAARALYRWRRNRTR